MANVSDSTSQLRVGWIGLGNMGLAMAMNLHTHLTKLQAPALRYNNRTMSRGQPLLERGATPSESITELVQNCDVVFLSLSDDAAVQAIVDQLLLHKNLASKIVVDTSTIKPSTTSSISSRLASAGALFVAAPVFGGTPVAVEGRLLVAMAGAASAVSIVQPYFQSGLARSVLIVGQDPTQATVLKTTGNFLTAAMAEAISEAHVLAEKAGLSTDVLDELIKQNYGEYAHSISEKLMTGVYEPKRGERPRSDVRLAIKDVGHGIEIARDVGAPLAIANLTMDHLVEAKKYADEQGRALDSSAVYGVIRVKAGLDFDNAFIKDRDQQDKI